MEEKDVIELSEKEIQDISQIQNKINQYNIALGVLRRQFLNAEGELIEKLVSSENDFSQLIRFLFQSKCSDKMDNWKFDFLTFSFKKAKNG